jgi:hypothetical protein
VFELANEAYYQLVVQRDIIGKHIRQALPEIACQGFEQLLDDVFETGQPFVGRRMKVAIQLERNGPVTENYVNVLCQSVLDAAGAVAQGHDAAQTERAHQAVAEKVGQLEQSRARWFACI